MLTNIMCNKFWVYLYNIEEPIQVTLTHDEKCEVDCSIGEPSFLIALVIPFASPPGLDCLIILLP